MARRVAIVGAGHVGVVYAAGLARLGHSVVVVDIDAERVVQLQSGRTWFYEPGLDALLAEGLSRGAVKFTTSYSLALSGAAFVFVCVPTPTTDDGTLDDRALRAALTAIAATAERPLPIVINKSTVPVGTTRSAFDLLGEGARVASNPEFLAEGTAVRDFLEPSRIVIGASDPATAAAVASLYTSLASPVIITDPTTAELAKLASNAFLATKISFANSVARVALGVGADPSQLAQILSLDPRIGRGHLNAGLGYGGSCLPKDLAAIEHLAMRHGGRPELFTAVALVNRAQRAHVVDVLLDKLGPISSLRVAILGGSFKPGTDDVRDSPALALAEDLVRLGCDVSMFDPVASGRLQEIAGGSWSVSVSAESALSGRDAAVIATAWPDFANLDLGAVRRLMRGNLIIDGRGVIEARSAAEAGLQLYSFAARDLDADESQLSAVGASASRHL